MKSCLHAGRYLFLGAISCPAASPFTNRRRRAESCRLGPKSLPDRLSPGDHHSENEMIPGKKPWTPEEDERLRTLLEAGTSLFLVAAKLRRTLAATRGRASIIGVSLKQEKSGLKVKK